MCKCGWVIGYELSWICNGYLERYLKFWMIDEVVGIWRLYWIWVLNGEGEGCVYLGREKLKREVIFLFLVSILKIFWI